MRLALQSGGWLAIVMMAASVSPAAAGEKNQTFTGEVSDAACGVHHMMEGSAADCTRRCVRGGSKYVLVTGDKVYTLETKDKAAQDKLDELAGQQAKVTGRAEGDTISVRSVAAGK
jgi:hypothetical protein